MLQNEYLVVKIGVDTAENEPLKVLTSFFNIFHSGPYSLQVNAAGQSALRACLKLFTAEERLEALTLLDRFGVAQTALQRAETLSGGQQQRLTLARALSLEPEILCLDEFSIAIDPVTTMKIEDVLTSLKSEMTIILVTNLIQQAQRISDNMMFLNNSEIVEQGPTPELFANPKNELTARYLSGEMG